MSMLRQRAHYRAIVTLDVADIFLWAEGLDGFQGRKGEGQQRSV